MFMLQNKMVFPATGKMFSTREGGQMSKISQEGLPKFPIFPTMVLPNIHNVLVQDEMWKQKRNCICLSQSLWWNKTIRKFGIQADNFWTEN